jgi:hypothetical protein
MLADFLNVSPWHTTSRQMISRTPSRPSWRNASARAAYETAIGLSTDPVIAAFLRRHAARLAAPA